MNHDIPKPSTLFNRGSSSSENSRPKLSIPLPSRQSEDLELKYVRALLKNQTIPDTFTILSYILSTTKHASVHNLIYNFIIKCLQNPLDIAECMKDDKIMTKSHSIEVENPQILGSANHIRQSYSSFRLDKKLDGSSNEETDGSKENENKPQTENQDQINTNDEANETNDENAAGNEDELIDNDEVNHIHLYESKEESNKKEKVVENDGERTLNHSSSFASFFSTQSQTSKENASASDFLINLLDSIPGMIPYLTKEETSDFISSIPQVFVSLTPDLKLLNSVGIPKIDYFKAASQCSIKILSLFDSKVIDRRETTHFIKMIIMASFRCSSILSDINRMTHMKKPLYFAYLNEFIPIVAKFLPILSNDTSTVVSYNNDDSTVDEGGMLLLLQQFWISLVAQSSGDMSLYSKSYRELKTIILFLPPLLSTYNPIDYQTISGSIQDLLGLLKFELYVKKKDEIVQMINKIVTSLSVKSLNAFNITDLILLLSIAVLEKMRSLFGKFVPMLQYLEVELYPNFFNFFDALIYPTYVEFQTYLTTVPLMKSHNEALEPVASYIFEKYIGDSPRLLPFIDKIIDQFITAHPLVLVCNDALHSYLSTLILLKKEVSPRLQAFKELGIKMFQSSIRAVPYTFINLLLTVIFNQSPNNYFVQSNEFLSIILDLILASTEKNIISVQFTSQLAMISKAKGALPFMNIKKIMKIENVNDRLLLLSLSYIDNQSMTAATNALISTFASSDCLMMVWSHIVSTPGYNGSAFVTSMIDFFKNTISSNKGIFELNDDDIDLAVIYHQATIIRFFNEQMLLLNFSDDILAIIPLLFPKSINKSSATFTAILSLICLVSNTYSIMRKKVDLVQQTAMIIYLMKLCLFSISFRTMPDIFKYINKEIMPYFEFDVNHVSNILKNSTLIYDLKAVVSLKKKGENEDSFAKIGDDTFQIIQIMAEITNSIVDDQLIFQKLGSMISYLMSSIYVLFITYLESEEKHQNEIALFNKLYVKPRNYWLNIIVPFFYVIYPQSIPSLCETLNCTEAVITFMPPLIEKYPSNAVDLPYIVAKSVPSKLDSCKSIEPSQICQFLKPEILADKNASNYLSKCFEKIDVDYALLFIPQFVQTLSFDTHKVVKKALVDLCKRSNVFCHFLLWNVTSEKSRLVFDPVSPKELLELEQEIFSLMSPDLQAFYDNELQLINSISYISRQLLPMPPDERKEQLINHLSKLEFQSGLFIPSNPEFQILEIDTTHSYPLKSHSHVPILVRFKAVRNVPKKEKMLASALQLPLTKSLTKSTPSAAHVALSVLQKGGIVQAAKDGKKILNIRSITESNNSFTDRHNPAFISCIFKTEDDVRMEALMIQLIYTMKEIIKTAGIDCYLLPYNIHSTGTKRGVIEVIRNANTRHEIGEATHLPLLAYFKGVYGETSSPDFQRALNNFIKSIAPYSLVCYLFQVKDRHNANIMIDDQGHVIHIDFGFIFDISPGGNMKFEKAAFKLNGEMIELLGGSKTSEAFIRFSKLFTQCFLAVRSRYEEIESIAYLMKDAGFPCFKPDSFKKLHERFFLDKLDTELQSAIDYLITGSMNAVTTTAYDVFQHNQNGIFYI